MGIGDFQGEETGARDQGQGQVTVFGFSIVPPFRSATTCSASVSEFLPRDQATLHHSTRPIPLVLHAYGSRIARRVRTFLMRPKPHGYLS